MGVAANSGTRHLDKPTSRWRASGHDRAFAFPGAVRMIVSRASTRKTLNRQDVLHFSRPTHGPRPPEAAQSGIGKATAGRGFQASKVNRASVLRVKGVGTNPQLVVDYTCHFNRHKTSTVANTEQIRCIKLAALVVPMVLYCLRIASW